MSHQKIPGSPAYEKDDSPVHGASDEVLFGRRNFIPGLNGPASEPAPPPTASSIIARGIGGIKDVEQLRPVHPSSWWYPPRGMAQGLYRDVVQQRTKCLILYYAAALMQWAFMLLQLCISATLTALGSVAVKNGTPITVLGAVNTVSASILAFLHNSGIPDRYRKDMDELRQVEDHIKELLDSGIAPVTLSPEQIIAECFDLYQDAKATMKANLPDNYRNRQTTPVRRQPATPIESGNAAPADSTQDTSSGIRGNRLK
ncbi:hypothetical protein MY3296_001968 [Beauveria thailandica]